MKILLSKTESKTIEKAFGKKDLSKLHKEVVTDKNGHRTTVWKKNDKDELKGRPQAQNDESKKENSFSGSVAQGDEITFAKNGQDISGAKVEAKGKNGVSVSKNGVMYQVPWSDIKKVDSEASKSAVRDLYDMAKINPKFRYGESGLQPEKDMTKLWQKCENAREDFSKKSESIVEKFKDINPILLKRPVLKGLDRAKEKLRADEIQNQREEKGIGLCYDEKTDTYNCESLRDIDGHTFCCSNVGDVAKLLKHFDSDKDIIRIKNNFAKPSPVGYSDINMNIKLPNGTIAEIQLNTMANMVAKECYGHALYEVFRSLDKTEFQELADIMGEAQKALYDMSNEYSKKGDFPSDIKSPFGVSHKPYEEAIKPFAKKAQTLYNKAVGSGLLNETTIKHYNELIQKIGL